MLFGLLPATAVINDVNKALINAYRKIAEVPIEFLEQISQLDSQMWEDGKAYYYSLRERYNEKLEKESMM